MRKLRVLALSFKSPGFKAVALKGERRAYAYLILLALILAIGNLLWTDYQNHQNHVNTCRSFAPIARIHIPQPVVGNPSRIALNSIVQAFRERDRQLGCLPQ